MKFGRSLEYRRFALGVNLFELVLVLAIIAVLAAIAIPRYGAAAGRYRADAAARRVVADLDLARTNACSSSQSRTVTFDLAGNRVSIPGVSDLKGVSYDYVTRLGEDPYVARIISADFGGDTQVVFDGWGIPDSDGEVVLRVGSVDKVVSLNQDTGKATVR